jgi:glycosyltransferase involved in cell wall biosynthesis
MTAWDRRSARGVTHFVAISDTVRERLKRCYGRESRVIYPPVDTEFYTPDSGGPRSDEYLCVSALVPYKRIDHAVTACSRLGRPLVVIGQGPERERLESLAGPTVRFLGWQPDDVIREHYRRCKALLFPCEDDFGIVPVEALACGAPVVALGRGGVSETLRDGRGRFYAEPTPEGLAAAIASWEADGSPHDAGAGRRRAEEFSTPLFRDRLLGHLAHVVSASSREPDRVPPPPHLVL